MTVIDPERAKGAVIAAHIAKATEDANRREAAYGHKAAQDERNHPDKETDR